MLDQGCRPRILVRGARFEEEMHTLLHRPNTYMSKALIAVAQLEIQQEQQQEQKQEREQQLEVGCMATRPLVADCAFGSCSGRIPAIHRRGLHREVVKFQ